MKAMIMMILMMIITIVIIIAIMIMMIEMILIIAVVIINSPFQPGNFSTGSTAVMLLKDKAMEIIPKYRRTEAQSWP